MNNSNKHIIACEVFKNELELLIKEYRFVYEITFLEQSLHENPQLLAKKLQETIDFIETNYAPDEIFLAYGFCGRGMYNVYAKKATLIIPKVHDCIPLLLGIKTNNILPDNQIETREKAETYWLSAGWTNYSLNYHIKEREQRYSKYIEEYGQDSADYLMEVEASWKSQYKSVCLITWDELYNAQLLSNTLEIAKDMSLPCSQKKGSKQYLLELLEGGKNTEGFFHIPPYSILDIDADGNLDIRVIDEKS